MPRRGRALQNSVDLEHFMNYVRLSFRRGVFPMPALIEEAVTLASLALFIGMIAIWAQVIATL